MEIASHLDKPPRKIYTVTEKSGQVLQEWMDRPVAPGVSLKAFVTPTSDFLHDGSSTDGEPDLCPEQRQRRRLTDRIH